MLSRPPKRLAVRITPEALRHVRRGHPWVYADAITSINTDGEPGDLAVIFDDQRKFAAIGLYDPDSAIRIKLLHRGSPQTIDAQWFHDMCARAKAVRATLKSSLTTTGYRCIHGENDGLPGVILDRYDDTYVLKLYSNAWAPHLANLMDAIAAVFQPSALVFRTSRSITDPSFPPPGTVLIGELENNTITFLENGLQFEANVVDGQKTGHFLDQRDNRGHVRSLAMGKTVLDVFCCTGGFTVYSAAGGATSVHRVDLSHWAIEAGGRNIAHNLPTNATCQHTATVGDAVDSLVNLVSRQRQFDIVIVDPPSFANRQTQVPGALRAYRRLAETASKLVTPGGILVQASCSARITADQFDETVRKGIIDASRRVVDVTSTGHALDHPIGFAQGRYLKAIFSTLS